MAGLARETFTMLRRRMQRTVEAAVSAANSAGGTPAARVTRDQAKRFRLGMASPPDFSQARRAPDFHEHNSISRCNFRRCAKCGQRIQVAKVWATPA